MRDILIPLATIFVVSFIFGVGLFWLALWSSETQCFERTRGMGFERRWSMMGGCQIRTTPTTWIPLANYRVL